GERESTETPPEWAQLSVEPPLPEEQLFQGETVEQDLEASPPNPILGPLAGLRHALWVPIERKQQLRGVILAGSMGKQPGIPREFVEEVGAELALALGWKQDEYIAWLRNVERNCVWPY